MDAVELGYPVDVPKLMGSDGFGRARVAVNEVEAVACDSSTRVSIFVNTPIERCSTFLRQKDVTNSVKGLESATWDKIPETEPCKNDSQQARFQVEESSEQLQFRGTACPSSTCRPDFVQVQRKVGKTSGSSSGCSKRPRLAQLEDNMSSAVGDDVKDKENNIGPHLAAKCSTLEKSQTVRQKNNVSGKRGDKRSFKVPTKTKYDSFSMRAGLTSLGSAAGGSNFFGVNGLKSDIQDITKQVDDLSLKDLLDGTYECPGMGKDKGKKAANMNETFLYSVRKVCSLLPLAKPVQSQIFSEMDSNSNKKVIVCPPSSASLLPSGVNVDKGDICTTNISCEKESCSKPGTPVNLLDFPLSQPKDVLEKLALPPPKDLEALLMDAAKPSASSRSNSDTRSGKHISRRSSLPAFPWSHTLTGHCRTSPDAVKLLTSRSMCQGRWSRICSRATLGNSTNCFTNLELLTYDRNLVPPSTSISIPWSEWHSSYLATSSNTSIHNPESGVALKGQVNATHCPRVVAAAQTLCDITRSLRQNPNGIIKWPKKPSQKAMKARKSKSFEKAEEVFTTRISQSASDNLVRSGITPSKRPKLSMTENRKDTNGIRKGPISWSTPRSSRSSPHKSVRDSIAETRHSTADILRQSCVMPPPARIDKSSNSSRS